MPKQFSYQGKLLIQQDDGSFTSVDMAAPAGTPEWKDPATTAAAPAPVPVTAVTEATAVTPIQPGTGMTALPGEGSPIPVREGTPILDPTPNQKRKRGTILTPVGMSRTLLG